MGPGTNGLNLIRSLKQKNDEDDYALAKYVKNIFVVEQAVENYPLPRHNCVTKNFCSLSQSVNHHVP